MNWLNDFFQQIKWNIENFVWDIQDKIQMWKLDRELSKDIIPFVGEEYTSELDQAEGIAGAWEEKPKKKKKAKKKSAKKGKKSV
jgi:hypothetical protein